VFPDQYCGHRECCLYNLQAWRVGNCWVKLVLTVLTCISYRYIYVHIAKKSKKIYGVLMTCMFQARLYDDWNALTAKYRCMVEEPPHRLATVGKGGGGSGLVLEEADVK